MPILEDAILKVLPSDLGRAAEITLLKYNDTLEKILKGTAAAPEEFRGTGGSLTACQDSELALSYMFGNCYVKRLPKENILSEDTHVS